MAVVRYNCSRHTALNVSAWNFLNPKKIMMYTVYAADVIEVLCSVWFSFHSFFLQFHNTHQFVTRNVDEYREKKNRAKPKQMPLFFNEPGILHSRCRESKKNMMDVISLLEHLFMARFLCKSNTSSRLFAFLRMIFSFFFFIYASSSLLVSPPLSLSLLQ